ncbi:MAG: phenylalanine--tRNA ligase subunit alpha [Nitrospinota bacterium]|jgi:phenylalanyl-tRNA synthetase alpha chain|nr:phenylalanine--tRNA ligase subunit alpha [Nitrospinota bacterium]MDP7580873.1 phenylalanine--tRNA ligase subunit alpha [Nitrospinota bacterium]HJN02251.1 phenylalanine--tRNA ligase subunit alpha [Nitrospinota bacterium]
MKNRLINIKEEALNALSSVTDEKELNDLRVKYLGKKGVITLSLKRVGSLSSEERPEFGRQVNEVKKILEEGIKAKKDELKKKASLDEKKDFFDPTLPGERPARGTLHPITQVMDEVISIFTFMGFEVAEGPEIESDYYNFEALNIPKDHPARDMQDTFYITDDIVLRTHTSPVQIRTMEKESPPVRIIAPGKVYRCDSDISHTPMFHQVEGLFVDEGVSFAHLKGILKIFVHEVFGRDTALRFRPSFFPFTEPSAEVDVQCVICKGKGCRLCSNSGWLEILGAGMVDPEVFKSVNYDSEKWTGFAFGMGIERIAMLKYGIDDIRLFFENDLRFLKQF